MMMYLPLSCAVVCDGALADLLALYFEAAVRVLGLLDILYIVIIKTLKD